MRYLFIHNHYPGQYVHLLKQLVKDNNNKVVFITCDHDTASVPVNPIDGVEVYRYRLAEKPTPNIHQDSIDFDISVKRATAVQTLCGHLKNKGYNPDIIIGHHGWGELLNVQDVWPYVPLLGYFEYYYRVSGLDVGFDNEFSLNSIYYSKIRAKNAINHLALTNPGFGQTPTSFQLSTYPDWAQNKIDIIPEGVDLDVCRPNPIIHTADFILMDRVFSSQKKIVTFVARNLEPMRGFHIMMRALPGILENKDAEVVIVGSTEPGYGPALRNTTWKDFFCREMVGKYDVERVHFLGHISYRDHIALLQRSDVHVYLTYPFVASWSLREAIACGCCIVASNTKPVLEFIQDGVNGSLVSFFNYQELSEKVTQLLGDSTLRNRLSHNAAHYALKNLSLTSYLDNYRTSIEKCTQR